MGILNFRKPDIFPLKNIQLALKSLIRIISPNLFSGSFQSQFAVPLVGLRAGCQQICVTLPWKVPPNPSRHLLVAHSGHHKGLEYF